MDELKYFVLEFCRLAGGIVEPAGYGTYEALLPEAVADRLGVEPYQRLTFVEQNGSDTDEDTPGLNYGHPLVEAMVEASLNSPANTLLHINNVRLEKPGLTELARQSLALSNARLNQAPGQSQAQLLHHYVRFTFQAALTTDEKHEQVVSVLMDAQRGQAVPELTDLEHKAVLESENAFKHLSPAPPHWLPSESDPLSHPALEGLLERAVLAVRDALAAPIRRLTQRAERFLELDQARLTQYYDDIERDLARRRDRTTDEKRQAAIQDKLRAAQAERQAKLADVKTKYHLRIELRLLNLMIVTLPKLTLRAEIKHRNTQVARTVVWNPLLHQIEPLVCDVCGQAATRLTLCSGGHLVHTDRDCLLADDQQCVDCKRIFCRLCADQVQSCVVCERPVCRPSLNRCAECGRDTCHEHVGLCHADEGSPLKDIQVEAQPPSPDSKGKQDQPPARESEKPKKPPQPTKDRATKERRSQPRRRRSSRPKGPKAAKIEVYVETTHPLVSAFVLTSGGTEIAVRAWEMTDEGIIVGCRCEKGWRCPVNRALLEPDPPDEIDYQLWTQVGALRQEYDVSPKKVNIYSVVRGTARPTSRLTLRGAWKA